MIERWFIAAPFGCENTVVGFSVLIKYEHTIRWINHNNMNTGRPTAVDTNPPKVASLSAFMKASNAPVGPYTVFQYKGSLFV